jgi:hypothetical protein
MDFPEYCFGKMDRRDCTSVSACVGVGREEVSASCSLVLDEEDTVLSLRVISLPTMIVPMNDAIATEKDLVEF